MKRLLILLPALLLMTFVSEAHAADQVTNRVATVASGDAGGLDAAPAATPLPAASVPAGAIPATPAAAPGGPAPMPETSIGDVVAAARAGKWLVAIGGVLILLVGGLKWVARKSGFEWFHSDRGGAVLVGVTSLLGALGTTWIAPGAHVDFTTFAAAAALTWTAAGGYTWLQRIISPKDQKPVTPAS